MKGKISREVSHFRKEYNASHLCLFWIINCTIHSTAKIWMDMRVHVWNQVVADVTLCWWFCWNDIAVYSFLPLLWQKTLALTSFSLLILKYFFWSLVKYLLEVFHVPYVLCVLVQGAGPADCTTWTRTEQRKSVWTYSISQRLWQLRRGHKDACVCWRSQGEAPKWCQILLLSDLQYFSHAVWFSVLFTVRTLAVLSTLFWDME